MSRTLCERCQRFDIQAFGRDKFPYRGVHLMDVVRSAEHCSFCSLLIEHLQETHRSHNIVRTNKSVRPYKYSMNVWVWSLWWLNSKLDLIEGSWINFSIIKGVSQAEDTRRGLNIAAFEVFLGAFRNERVHKSVLKFHVAADPGTPASTSGDIAGSLIEEKGWTANFFESVQSWRNECDQNHPTCRSTLSGTLIKDANLPTRCIETFAECLQSDAKILRHVLRETSSGPGQYIILSHKWDDQTKQSKTTRANVACRLGKCGHGAQHKQCCISTIDGISQVFIDACIFAYQLGIKYVWIDSLCIVQPDGDRGPDMEDWKRESPQIANYYQYAWATIAVVSTSTSGGLFNLSRVGTIPRIAALPYRDVDGAVKGSFYLQRARPDVLRQEFRDHIEGSLLRERGWVYQEWKLSRRIIAFSASGFYLDCKTSGAVSSIGDKLDDLDNPRTVRNWLKQYMIRMVGQRALDASIERWQEFVSGYAGLGLSNLTEDIFVALAGVASEYGQIVKALEIEKGPLGCIGGQNKTKARYACGIWLRRLDELLWEQAVPGPRWRVSGIPTWSWASMARDVVFEDCKSVPCTGLKVHWPTFDLQNTSTVAEILKATTISVNEQSWLPQFDKQPPEQPK